jgi:hypothetical protein
MADDAGYRRGFRYKATVWVHTDGGDDTYAVLYFKERPTPEMIRKVGKQRGSRLPDDFRIEPMKPLTDGKKHRK